jgi:SAM-dependent methyltransferase
MKYYNLIQAFNKSQSDKNHMHKYAIVYDYIINSHYLLKGSPLNLLEIGIRRGDSIDVWDNSPLFNKIVGVDIQTQEQYEKFLEDENIKWDFSDKVTLLPGVDGYSKEFTQTLKDKNEQFDIILDDGDHMFESQIKFFNLYYDLLAPGGVIMCEDINQNCLPQLSQLAKEYEDFYVFDLRAKSNEHGNEIIAILKK